MSIGKWTPGPWHVDYNGNELNVCVKTDQERAWDAILQLWVGECCQVNEVQVRKGIESERPPSANEETA